MKGGSKLFIFAGVGLALVAILLLVTNLQGGGKADANKADTAATKVKIVEAKVDIPAHGILKIEDLTEREVSSTEAPADAVNSISEVVGKAYRSPLTAGQPLVRAMIEVPGLRNDISAGMRAVALPVDEVSAMSGLVQDGDYIDIVFHARINLLRQLPTNGAEILEDATYKIEKPTIIPPDLETPNHPLAGKEGSEFAIRDDIGDAGELEAVAKIMLQDIRVLRVVRPGDKFLGDGTKADEGLTDGAMSSDGEQLGQLILEVTPEQAELVTFIQDKHQTYQVIVRGKDDHTKVNTSGITYDILATDPDWALPWPKTVVAPEGDQSAETNNNEDQPDQSDESDDE